MSRITAWAAGGFVVGFLLVDAPFQGLANVLTYKTMAGVGCAVAGAIIGGLLPARRKRKPNQP
jgi:membrane protein DedA with SNARE-associated domain